MKSKKKAMKGKGQQKPPPPEFMQASANAGGLRRKMGSKRKR